THNNPPISGFISLTAAIIKETQIARVAFRERNRFGIYVVLLCGSGEDYIRVLIDPSGYFATTKVSSGLTSCKSLRAALVAQYFGHDRLKSVIFKRRTFTGICKVRLQ